MVRDWWMQIFEVCVYKTVYLHCLTSLVHSLTAPTYGALGFRAPYSFELNFAVRTYWLRIWVVA